MNLENNYKKQLPVTDIKTPTLKKISDAKEFSKKINIAKENFDFLGEGSSRVVFKLSDDYVIKIAKNDKGIAQNLSEMRPELQTSVTNKILVGDKKGSYIITSFAEDITEKEFEELTDMNFKQFSAAILYKFNQEDEKNFPKPRDYEEIKKNEYFKKMIDLIVHHDLLEGDAVRISSYGKIGNKVKLVDYGLDRDIYKKLYNKKKK